MLLVMLGYAGCICFLSKHHDSKKGHETSRHSLHVLERKLKAQQIPVNMVYNIEFEITIG
jgi:hypothetical protein